MRIELVKEFRFEAAHQLPMVPPDHKCFRMHGHSYRIEVMAEGEVDPQMGWLVDFGDVSAIVEPILKQELDHRTLNDVPGLENPTSEILAKWIRDRLRPKLPSLVQVTLFETCYGSCEYVGDCCRRRWFAGSRPSRSPWSSKGPRAALVAWNPHT